MAEWLRRLTANQLGLSRAGSNPALRVLFNFMIIIKYHNYHKINNLLGLFTLHHDIHAVVFHPWVIQNFSCLYTFL